MKEGKRRVPRGSIVSALILLVLAGCTAVVVSRLSSTGARQTTPKDGPPVAVFTAKATPERLARGRYLMETVAGCFDCHAPFKTVNGVVTGLDLSKKGAGRVAPAEPLSMRLPPGSLIVAPNITPDRATGIGTWSDADIERAIRHGVAKDGRPLFETMPYWEFRVLTDEDVKSIIVYLRSLRPVRNALPATKLPFPVKVEMNDDLVGSPPRNASALVRRGWYLTQLAKCVICHTPVMPDGSRSRSLLLAGGRRFSLPTVTVFSLNITPSPSGIGFMTEQMFSRTIRTGRVNGNGLKLSPAMPYWHFRNLKESDVKAIYAYLRTVPKVRHEIDNTDPPTYCKIDGLKHGLGDRN